ncbi:signal peptide-containing protein [Cryptosporidium canis]|uniref:Signal peptide-containing protein n=1 Tax=Cryptosporidium canis TaxID=195482 RepID=A0ABQ8PD19_9CRYT|nr:signal peptide-containing protein [Cryptosporidium canis]KAJ1615553.1 signal peptide-containing protein [Cryptosporidium canis]
MSILLGIPSIYIFILYHISLFSIITSSNQQALPNSIAGQTNETAFMINGCRDIFGCNQIEEHTFNSASFGICESCQFKSLKLDCSSIPLNTSYQILGFTDDFGMEYQQLGNLNKTNPNLGKFLLSESMTLLSGKFSEINGTENCNIDNSNNIELLQETYIIHKHRNNEDMHFNIRLSHPFQMDETSAINISDWVLQKGKDSHALYIFTRFWDKIGTKYEIYPTVKSLVFNKIWSSIGISCNMTSEWIYNNLEICMRVSCLKGKGNIADNISHGEHKSNTTLKDVINSVNLLKSKVKSERDYLLYVSIFIKTLLNSLERKTKRGRVSLGCLNRMVSWIIELCEALGIRTEEDTKIGRHITKFKMLTNKESIKGPANNTEVLSAKKTKFIEAALEDYERLERELRGF